MPTPIEVRMQQVLVVRKKKGLLRELRPQDPRGADFSSNDYLGLSRSNSFQTFVKKRLSYISDQPSGSTGSRLLSGHSNAINLLEQISANFHRSEAALLFNSGYDANLSLLSCLPGPHDVVIYDEFIHASMHDGMRASRARHRTYSFRHNDISSLRDTIRLAVATGDHSGNVLVCVETVYSMDGDVAPLREMLSVAQELSNTLARDVLILADEAHAGGIFGQNGAGLAVEQNVFKHPNLMARVVTFGKAFAAHGSVILGSKVLVQYLINYARPFIYSTALPPHSVSVINAVYEYAPSEAAQVARKLLWDRVGYFQKVSSQLLPQQVLLSTNGKSPIQGLVIPGNEECVTLSRCLQERNIDVYPIRSPTVPRGKERIRIIIHSHNSEEEILHLLKTTADILRHKRAKL